MNLGDITSGEGQKCARVRQREPEFIKAKNDPTSWNKGNVPYWLFHMVRWPNQIGLVKSRDEIKVNIFMETRSGQVPGNTTANRDVSNSHPHLGVEMPESDFFRDLLTPILEPLMLMTLF